MVMHAPIRRRLSLRGAPGVVSEDQVFTPHQVPLDVADGKQAAWNARQWREVSENLQTVGTRLRAVEQALLDLQAIVAGDEWDRS
jgi:hypothetical protein